MTKRQESIKRNAIDRVFRDLQNRNINPSGEFDNGGRWHADNDDLISVRSPSRRWPYPEMHACRTKKYVLAVWEKFGCKSEKTLRKHI